MTFMVKIYFLGGEDVNKRSGIRIYKEALKETGSSPKVLILPWTSEDQQKNKKYFHILYEYFLDLGAESIFSAKTNEPIMKFLRK